VSSNLTLIENHMQFPIFFTAILKKLEHIMHVSQTMVKCIHSVSVKVRLKLSSVIKN